MPKLSAVDQAFFLLETRERPMSIGALIVLAPPAGTGARFADRLIRQMLRQPAVQQLALCADALLDNQIAGAVQAHPRAGRHDLKVAVLGPHRLDRHAHQSLIG